ncbi:MAG TPA: hypothetical protein VGI40_04230 [Pirellulaceae bacterium]|jgi:hypothetical protein
MNLNLRSKQQPPGLLHEEQAEEAAPADALPGRGSSRVFYVFSAVIHIAAAVALSGTWVWHSSANKAQAETVPESPTRPAMARMAIDVGPIKFCEMNIETLVGRPQSPTER